MNLPRPRPIALTIAGSDSGGGAGVQADLKTFMALGVHGATVVTCLTAQNPARVRAVQAVSPALVRSQLAAVLDELPPAAVKTGMLYSAGVIRVVVEWCRGGPRRPLVVDPVMISTSRESLLKKGAKRLLLGQLLPLAALVTPNLEEAGVILGCPVRSLEDMRRAARAIHSQFGCAALVKGGHLRGTTIAADIFYSGKHEMLLEAPFVRGIVTHGTGCTYSAAITAYLARGCPLARAVPLAKEFITQAIARSYRIGRHSALNPGWNS